MRCPADDPQLGALASVLAELDPVPAHATLAARSCVLPTAMGDVELTAGSVGSGPVVVRLCGLRGGDTASLCEEMREPDAAVAPGSYVLEPWGALPPGSTAVVYIELVYVGPSGHSSDGYVVEQDGDTWTRVVRVIHGEQ